MQCVVTEVHCCVNSYLQMKRGHDLFRGRLMVLSLFVGAAVCYMTILSGRRLRDSGYSLSKQTEAEIAALQEQGRLEREARMKKP